MSRQQPWRGPDGRRNSPGHGSPPGRPEQRKEKPEKESRLVAFREWLNTGTGLAALAAAVVGLLISGAASSSKIFPSPKPSQIVTPSPPVPQPDHSSTSPVPSFSLRNALLSRETVSSTAIVQSTGTDLSQIGTGCGGPASGDTATAYETIEDQQAGTFLTEELVSWDSVADAGKAITANRQAVDQNGGCSYTHNRVTAHYTGDYEGSPPSSCEDPGQYFATQIEVTKPSLSFPYSGFVTGAQCGAVTIIVLAYTNQSGGVTQQTANGYLSFAIGQLDRQR